MFRFFCVGVEPSKIVQHNGLSLTFETFEQYKYSRNKKEDFHLVHLCVRSIMFAWLAKIRSLELERQQVDEGHA